MPRGEPSDANTKSTAYPPQLAGIPTFEITPYGIRARLPVLETGYGPLGLLFVSSHDGKPLFLPLKKNNTAADPTRPLYRIRCTVDVFPVVSAMWGRASWNHRLTTLWRVVYFEHNPRSLSLIRLRVNRDTTTPFYIPLGTLVDFTQRHPDLRFVHATLPPSLTFVPDETTLIRDESTFAWDFGFHATLVFEYLSVR